MLDLFFKKKKSIINNDVSEGIDVNKMNASEESDTCHYWYFLDKGFSFNHTFAMDFNEVKNLWTLMILLFLLREVIPEFIFGI